MQGPAALSTALLNNPPLKTLTPLFNKAASVAAIAFGLANTFKKVWAFAPLAAT